MGDGSSDSIDHPPQVGVITYPGESFPFIPYGLLAMTPEELLGLREKCMNQIRYEETKILALPDEKKIARLEYASIVFEFAAVAVERQNAAIEAGKSLAYLR